MADDMTEQMKKWGHAMVARYVRTVDGPRSGESILSKNRDLAPGTKERAERQLVARSGLSRRTYMATNLRVAGVRVIPLWACDPVRAKNDAQAPHDNPPEAVVDVGLPDEVRWIDDAVRQMERLGAAVPVMGLRAMILREEFCGRGFHEDKVRRIKVKYAGKLTVRQYRTELKRAIEWIEIEGRRRAA